MATLDLRSQGGKRLHSAPPLTPERPFLPSHHKFLHLLPQLLALYTEAYWNMAAIIDSPCSRALDAWTWDHRVSSQTDNERFLESSKACRTHCHPMPLTTSPDQGLPSALI